MCLYNILIIINIDILKYIKIIFKNINTVDNNIEKSIKNLN